ncbi:hypothetical protein [Roseovarius aquimarinus]|uniref:Uncharacterized protein n=1 Tax=Roseovarius aquimarinus TaxID=1229156 RepID=A0ABW7I4T9_9RHOB
MRTKWQQIQMEDATMIAQIKTAAARSQDTLLGDALGMASLVVLLMGCLYLPGLVQGF